MDALAPWFEGLSSPPLPRKQFLATVTSHAAFRYRLPPPNICYTNCRPTKQGTRIRVCRRSSDYRVACRYEKRRCNLQTANERQTLVVADAQLKHEYILFKCAEWALMAASGIFVSIKQCHNS